MAVYLPINNVMTGGNKRHLAQLRPESPLNLKNSSVCYPRIEVMK